jgi:hypothetical protein
VELELDEQFLGEAGVEGVDVGPPKAPGGLNTHGPDRHTVGGLLVRLFDGNDAPRQKITIEKVKPATFKGNVLVKCASDKVEIFDAATAGTKIALDGTHNKFHAADLPKDLFVQGVKPSDNMRDVEVSIDIVGVKARADFIKFTVLWVDKPVMAFGGPISPNNARIGNYKAWTKSGTDNLGLQLYNATFGERMGFGSQASAVVHPTKFKYAGNNLKLERDVAFHDWVGNGTSTIGQRAANATLPPGNDTGPDGARDDDPDPDDTIYDFDAAGLAIPDAPADEIHRTRNNFRAFASITVEGKTVRCSEIQDYRVRFSMKQATAPHGADWQVVSPPDVAGDNDASNGTTNLTWDLT